MPKLLQTGGPKLGQLTNGFDFFETYEVENVQSAQKAINKILTKLNERKIDNKIWLEKNSWENHVDIILKELKNV